MPPPALVWYRPSIRRQATQASVRAMLPIVVGALGIGALRVARVDFGNGWIVGYLAAIALVAMGPLYLITRFGELIGRERVFSIHMDGVRWLVGNNPPSFCSWADLGEPHLADGELVVPNADEPWRLPQPFEGITTDALVRQLLELRQKALLGLPIRLRSPPLVADRE